jgi:phosphoglycolate phosphatase-like HAD superfamily hydrolase
MLLTAALTALGVPAAAAAFLGDSTTDITAAHSAGTMSIGYTNKPGKSSQLITAGADAMIHSPATITEQITADPR